MQLILIWLKIILITVTVAATLSTKAQTASSKGDDQVSDVQELSVDASLLELARSALNEELPNKPQVLDILTSITVNFSKNSIATSDAEQVLIYYLKGYVAFREKDFEEAIKWLTQAEVHAEKLPESQIHQSEYFAFYFVLADSYAAIRDFDKAYSAKRQYLIKNYRQTQENHKEMLAELAEKYQLASKEQQNQLLDRQSVLKQSEIAKSKQIKYNQERNIIVLICVAIVFGFMILRQVKVRKRLLWMTQTDSLTKLDNRGSLFEHGYRLVNETLEDDTQLSVVLLDIDGFKQINDKYGHDIGDQVLQLVAKFGKEVMRSRDIFARLGGEEFVALLPQATIDEANTIAHRLKEKIALANTSSLTENLSISASFGVANLADVSTDFDALINAADIAMYQAKSAGKNSVVKYVPVEQ